MFKIIKKNWELAKKIGAAKVEMSYRPSFTRIQPQKVQGVEVFVDDAMIHQYGVFYAGVLLMEDGSTRIYVDSEFLTWPTHVQLFALQHEMGHINLRHYEGPLAKSIYIRRIYLRFWGAISTEEMEADEYAYQKVGTVKSLAALDWLRQHVEHKAMAKEINNRYNLMRTYPFVHPEVRENKLCPECGKEMPLGICGPCTDRYFDQKIAEFMNGGN